MELMEKSRSVLEAPRAAIERGRSNPMLGIAAIAGALLLIAWIAWAIYVTNDNGASAGLGVMLSWPVLLAALVLVASPFVGVYFLVKLLRPSDEESPSISGDSADAEAETEEKPAGESEDEEPDDGDSEDDEPDDEDSGDEADDEENPEEDAEEEEDEPEETDPDEEPPSGEKEPSVSG